MPASCILSVARRAFSATAHVARNKAPCCSLGRAPAQSTSQRTANKTAFAPTHCFVGTSHNSGHQAFPSLRNSTRGLASARSVVMAAASGAEVATLGGGCFWCLEACYQQLKGVLKVESGYAGGHVTNPTYEQVCGKKTGHVEVVQVTYDPSVVSFQDILSVFFTIHDPTTRDRQGNDVGPQYRSAIFYHDEAQKQVAEEVMQDLADQKLWPAPIVTELRPLNDNYYTAEKYHQNYFNDNPFQGYCMFVVAPKVQKFRAKWAARLMK